MEGRPRERTASTEYIYVSRYEAETLAILGETMFAVWGRIVEVDAGPHSQDHISGTGPHEVVPQDVETNKWGGHSGRKSCGVDPVEKGHGQRNRQAHREDQNHEMAYNGTPSPLAMGGACGQKAWHHELRGGDGLYLPKQEGATTTALVTFAPQFQYQGAVGKRRFVDTAGTGQNGLE